MDDVNERDVRMLAADVLKTVNRGGHSAQDLVVAKKSLEEALSALRHEGRPGLTQELMAVAAKYGCSMGEVEEAIRSMGAQPKPVATC